MLASIYRPSEPSAQCICYYLFKNPKSKNNNPYITLDKERSIFSYFFGVLKQLVVLRHDMRTAKWCLACEPGPSRQSLGLGLRAWGLGLGVLSVRRLGQSWRQTSDPLPLRVRLRVRIHYFGVCWSSRLLVDLGFRVWGEHPYLHTPRGILKGIPALIILNYKPCSNSLSLS